MQIDEIERLREGKVHTARVFYMRLSHVRLKIESIKFWIPTFEPPLEGKPQDPNLGTLEP